MLIFVFATIVILGNAEMFSEGLIASGKMLHVNEFLLVQWIAPLASEAPEFIVALMFASRGNAGLALGCLLSSKLNQWTLLVGMIPGVYAASSGGFSPSINLDTHQFQEILLTAGQSLFAVALLLDLRLHVREAIWLLLLFSLQLLSPLYDVQLETMLGQPLIRIDTKRYLVAWRRSSKISGDRLDLQGSSLIKPHTVRA